MRSNQVNVVLVLGLLVMESSIFRILVKKEKVLHEPGNMINGLAFAKRKKMTEFNIAY